MCAIIDQLRMDDGIQSAASRTNDLNNELLFAAAVVQNRFELLKSIAAVDNC